MSGRVAKCPRCKSTELSIEEWHEEFGSSDYGEVRIVDGELVPPGPFWFEVGDTIRVMLRCVCGHVWRSRWSVSGMERT